MLEVSGVGEFKYEKYGERFLQKIRELTAREAAQQADQELPEEEDEEEIPLEEDLAAPVRKNKQPFVMTEEIAQKIQFSSRVTLSEFVKQLNSLRDEKTVRCLAFQDIMQHLIEEGYLVEEPGAEESKSTGALLQKDLYSASIRRRSSASTVTNTK